MGGPGVSAPARTSGRPDVPAPARTSGRPGVSEPARTYLRPPSVQAGLEAPATMNATDPTFSAEQLAEVRRLQALYPDARGALLPVLYMAQDTFGWISLETEEYVAGLFNLSPAHVHEVVTFYTLYFQIGRAHV